jgi:hypothetical protein
MCNGLMSNTDKQKLDNISWLGTAVQMDIHDNTAGATKKWAFCGSDRRLKCDIEPMNDGALVLVKQLKPSAYKWKNDNIDETEMKPDSECRLGFMYDEIKEVIPEVTTQVNEHKWIETGEAEDWQKDFYGKVNYAKVVPVLVKALQELSDKVEELEKKLQDKEED